MNVSGTLRNNFSSMNVYNQEHLLIGKALPYDEQL